MRVTIDIDREGIRHIIVPLLKGIIVNRKLPDKIRKTGKGYHIIWSGLDISFEESIRRRKIIGDDPNRVRLDSIGTKRIKQVLFKEKVVTCKGFLPKWWSPDNQWHNDICPVCGEKMVASQKVWTDEEKAIYVLHKNYKCLIKKLK